MSTPPDHFTRSEGSYLVSSNPSHLDLTAINAAFASPSMWWCSVLPPADLQKCLDGSLCLGLYKPSPAHPVEHHHNSSSSAHSEKLRQIGLARIVTDHTTMAYLTDVYVVPDEQGQGLGRWLIQCVGAWADELPYLRRLLLIGREGVGERFYRETLGTERFEQGRNGSMMLARRGPALRKPDAASVGDKAAEV